MALTRASFRQLQEWFICQNADYALGNNTNEQKLFDAVANGTLAIETGLYFFEALLYITGMSSTSGNAAFDILGAGTATIDTQLFHVIGYDNTLIGAVASATMSMNNAQTATNMITAGTGTILGVSIRGMFRLSAGGTIIPSITLQTASAAVVKRNSFFKCRRVGSETAVSAGSWS